MANAISIAEVLIEKICSSQVEELVETAMKIGESRSDERKRKRSERIALGRKKREELLQELEKRKRKELAELKSLECRMKAWKMPKIEPATRKREKQWYHTEMQPKKRRVTPCCDMRNEFCMECQVELEGIFLLEGTLVFNMDPETISSKYLKDSLLPLISPAVQEHKNRDSGCTVATRPAVYNCTVRSETEKVVKNGLQLPKTKDQNISPVKGLRRKSGVDMKPRKVKRWVKKSNGLFGWVTTSEKKESQAQVKGGRGKSTTKLGFQCDEMKQGLQTNL